MERTGFDRTNFSAEVSWEIWGCDPDLQIMKIIEKWLKTDGQLYMRGSISEIAWDCLEKQFAKG